MIPAFHLYDQRFMVSPCGYYSGMFDIAEIADEAPGWTDCTEMSDIEVDQLMRRRMWATDCAKHAEVA